MESEVARIISHTHSLMEGKPRRFANELISGTIGTMVGEAGGGPIGAALGGLAAAGVSKLVTKVIGEDEDKDED
jgi:hypothetical protein